ncbi:MAG: hypothetical protein KF680_08235 [Cryobacterium sp.]|nr:hypothetical protein [Cryobacterium sp.]
MSLPEVRLSSAWSRFLSRVLLPAVLPAVLLAVPMTATARAQSVPPLQAGMRVTFYSSSASVRGSTQQAVFKPNCDPSKEDCWVDGSGRSIGLQDVPTASGQGYAQLDVLYLDQQTCVLRITIYTLDPGSGAVATAASGGTVSTESNCEDYWFSPARLQQLPTQDTGGFRVLRGPYTIGNFSFDSVSIGSFGGGSASHSSYDAASGLLIVASTRSQGGAVPTIVGNTVTPGAGNTQLTYTQWLNSRSLPASGLLERLPAHVQGTTRLVYSCVQVTTLPGSGAVQIPCHYELALGQRNELWVRARGTLQVSDGITNIPSVTESEHVIAASGHGGYLASPTWLASLQQGGVQLDSDPVTGVVAFVESVTDDVVVIVERSNAELKRFAYDRRTGWLRQVSLEQSSGLAVVSQYYELTGVQ